MGGKVTSTTEDMQKYEYSGYHKQGSIEDENFLYLAEKIEDANVKLSSIESDLESYKNKLDNIATYLNNINISINGGNENG